MTLVGLIVQLVLIGLVLAAWAGAPQLRPANGRSGGGPRRSIPQGPKSPAHPDAHPGQPVVAWNGGSPWAGRRS